MNTLNNQQINPGNRVDFSRIRRFAEGGVPKFKTPAGTLSNTSNNSEDFWTNFNNDIITRWGQIAGDLNFNINDVNTFLQQNRNLARTTGYNGTRAVYGQGVKQYQQDFHNKYGFGNTDSFWSGMNTANNPLNTGDIRLASGLQFIGDDYFGTLTDYRRANYFSADELTRANEAIKNRGWQFVLDDAQNEGHTVGTDGRRFYKLQLISTTLPSNENTPDFSSESINKYQASTYIPPYKQGYKDTSAIDAIYRNNIDSIERQKQLLLDTTVPLQQGVYRLSDLTSNYLLQSLLKNALANQQYAFDKQIAQLGDSGQRTLAMLQFNTDVINPILNQILNIQSTNTQLSKAQINADKNYNIGESVRVDNYNRRLLSADKERRNNIETAAEAKRSAETAQWINNTDVINKMWGLAENASENKYNYDVNRLRYQEELLRATDDYYNGIKQITGENAQGLTITYNDVISSLEEEIQNKGDLSDIDAFYENRNNPESLLLLLKKYRTINGVENVNIASWLNNYSQYDGEKTFLVTKNRLNLKLNYLNLFTDRLSFNNIRGGLGLNINWDTVHDSNIPYYKKGNKIKDRFEKYVERYKKEEKELNDRSKHANELASKKLLRELDALDRETLLLLRSIFK